MNCEYSWKISEDSFCLEDNLNNESLYTLANGYMGMRGDGPEQLPPRYSKRGTFINGFYETSTIPYGESAYGFAKNMQTMLNVCDAKLVTLTLEGETFSLLKGTVRSWHRELDMKNGLEIRDITWESPEGRIIRVVNRNLVSLAHRHIAVRTMEVTPVNFSGEIIFSHILDGETKTGEETDDPRVSGSLLDGGFGCTAAGFTAAGFKAAGFKSAGGRNIAYIEQSTKRTALSLMCAACSQTDSPADSTFHKEDNRVISSHRVAAAEGTAVTLTVHIAYATSQHGHQPDYRECALENVCRAMDMGFASLTQQQSQYLERFWESADISITGDEAMTRSMRFNLFQLLQSVGKDSHTSIPSKGLSGEGYGGHYFWESEAYIAPMFMISDETIARKMLEYRYSILDKAREQARLLGHLKGALFSWRTIAGEESSAYFPAGSAQYHINADVAFAVHRYLDAAQDMDFLMKCGLELLLETARLWIDVGHYAPLKGGCFCIDGVTGPDEYTAIVDNNCYTNAMARENLWNAVKAANAARAYDPAAYAAVCKKIGFEETELDAFQAAADSMYIPYCKELGIHMQDDTFLNKKVLDFNALPQDKRPLLLHYHPMFIYRHQVCKQADLILAEYFLPDRFTAEDKKRDYEYYEKLTTHDSSLSACVFSIMAAETGDLGKAYSYFIQTVRTDLDDNQKNTRDGLHMANMAGAWACIIYGFGGLKIRDGIPCFRPLLPENWKGYRFCMKYRGGRLEVEVTPDGVCYRLKSPGSMTICHNGKNLEITQNQEVSVS